MPLETAAHISQLVPTNPASSDGLNQADDHLRLLKQVLLTDIGPSMTDQKLTVVDGTAAAPSITFASEPTLGLYRIGPGRIGVVGGKIQGAQPVGGLHMFPKEPASLGKVTADTGKDYLECNGATYNVADYPELAAFLGAVGGTFTVPNMTDTGRFPRSRTSTVAAGTAQANVFKSHAHVVSGNTGNQSADHTHYFSGTTAGMTRSNPHTHSSNANITGPAGVTGGGSFYAPATGAATINSTDINHEHPFSGTTGGISAAHYHAFSVTSAATGDTETRPEALSFVFCIKT